MGGGGTDGGLWLTEDAPAYTMRALWMRSMDLTPRGGVVGSYVRCVWESAGVQRMLSDQRKPVHSIS